MNRVSKINGFQFFIFIPDSFFQRKSYSEELQNIKKINNNKKDNDRADQVEARVEGLGLLSQLHHFSFFFFLKESFLDYYLLSILNR